ncbi:hypothetical protein ACLF8P_01625 [Helicobacter pylori]
MNFTGGYRSGVQIDRNAPKRTYKYTKKDCDLILGIDTRTSECYIIPIEDTQECNYLASSKLLNFLMLTF